MNEKEQTALLKEMMQCGLMIAKFPNDFKETMGSEKNFLVKKFGTPHDPRESLEDQKDQIEFNTEDEAYGFVKKYINWEWQEEAEELPKGEEGLNPISYSFNVYMLSDVGFGPQKTKLGQLLSDCRSDQWYEELTKEADKRAEKYLKENYPDKKISEIKRDVKITPVWPD